MHAARGKPTRVQTARLSGGGCGLGIGSPDPCGPGSCEPGPGEPGSCGTGSCVTGAAEGGCASSRSIFASCSVRRASCSSARLICSWACASRSSARAGSVSFGSGVEFIGVFPFRPMPSEGSRSTSRPHPSFVQRMAVSWRERPSGGRMRGRMARNPVRRRSRSGAARAMT